MVTVAELKPYEDKTVLLHFRDGEVATVKVVFVDAEYEDIIVDIVTTNRPHIYKNLSSAAYTISAVEIERAEICPELR